MGFGKDETKHTHRSKEYMSRFAQHDSSSNTVFNLELQTYKLTPNT